MAAPQRDICRVIVLGSTGSIGTQTLEVIEHLNDLHRAGKWATHYRVVGLAAGRNASALEEQAQRFGMARTARGTCESAERVVELVSETPCDLVVAAISGFAGLPATLRALELGRDVALANKETLVAAGELMVAAARKSGSRILPVDSEHSGLWQALGGSGEGPPMRVGADVLRVVLTASGGPFRTWTREQIGAATPRQALQHPTWRMGPKVTIDSASLMNKGLEVIEAHWLFGLEPERIEVVVHPQSVVHAMVEYADGSTLAQLGSPDMRTPIQYALCHPRRCPGVARKLNWGEVRRLEFAEPDRDRFPALGLAYRAIREGGTAGAVLNAANEEAVQAFLRSAEGGAAIAFSDIAKLTEAAMDAIAPSPLACLDDVVNADRAARRYIRERLA